MLRVAPPSLHDCRGVSAASRDEFPWVGLTFSELLSNPLIARVASLLNTFAYEQTADVYLVSPFWRLWLTMAK